MNVTAMAELVCLGHLEVERISIFAQFDTDSGGVNPWVEGSGGRCSDTKESHREGCCKHVFVVPV